MFVDFSNAYLRQYLADTYCASHARRFDILCEHLTRVVPALQTGQKLAAVLDIDEVILSNIHTNSYIDAQNEFYACDYFQGPDGKPWPRGEQLGPLLPGARKLIDTLQHLDVDIFFITGRLEALRDETIKNFALVGLADTLLDATRLIMCPSALPIGASIQPWKESCRALIDHQHRIILNVGDQASDLGLYSGVQVLCQHPFYFTV